MFLQLQLHVGPEEQEVIDMKMGILSHLPFLKQTPSLCLGSETHDCTRACWLTLHFQMV